MTSKSVVITGASTGIGKACALYLDRLGYRVFAGVRRPLDAAALQQAASTRLEPVFIDVTNNDTILAAAHTITAAIGETGLAGLVNNAGIAVGGPLEFVPLEQLQQQLEINVVGQVAATQAFLGMLRQGKGRIINMSSVSGRIAMPFFGPYAASKFALEAITDSLRVELKPWNIEVISVQPGAIATPIWDKSIARAEEFVNRFPPEADALYGRRLVGLRKGVKKTGQRGISAEEVAKVVARALAARRPKTRYLVGQDAKTGALLATFLPDKWRDWFILNF